MKELDTRVRDYDAKRTAESMERGDKKTACSVGKAALAYDADDSGAFSAVRLSCDDAKLRGEVKFKSPFEKPPEDTDEGLMPQLPTTLAKSGPGFKFVPLGPNAAPDAQPPVVPRLKASDLAAADARTLLQAGDIDGALNRALAAIRANPKNVRAYLMRAYADKAKKDWPAVIKDAKDGLAVKPDDLEFLKLEADAENRIKFCKEAFQTAGRAVAVDPTDATAYALKAWALGCLGDREGMLALLRQAAALDPAFQKSLESAADLEGDSDLFFLFPEEEMPARKKKPSGMTRGQRLGIALGLALITFIGFIAVILRLVRSRGPGPAMPEAFGPGAQAAAPAQGTPVPAEPVSAVKAAPAQVASPEPGTGAVSERYDIRRKIGEGGMGVVFGGFDRELMRAVAIKKMRPELKERKEDMERFLAEARTVAELSHPYIVGIHDIVQKDGDVFLVFEFVDGKPLSSILNASKRLPFVQCRDIFSYVCQAMDCAHKAKILHLDLKPGNIMVDNQGFARVMDFGLARHAKDSLSRITRQDAAGTLAYMAPEQHRGVFCPASDIYAMGVCLYEMLTGRLPFSGPDFLAAKESLSYPALRTLAPDIPQAVEPVLDEVFRLDSKSRLGDSMEFLRRLREV